MKVPSLLLSVGQLSDTVDCGAGASLTACGERGILSLSVNGTEMRISTALEFHGRNPNFLLSHTASVDGCGG
jgi:hypothetical protein